MFCLGVLCVVATQTLLDFHLRLDSHGGGEISSSVPFHRKREEVAVDKYMVLKCSGSQYPIFVKIYDNGALGVSNVIGS